MPTPHPDRALAAVLAGLRLLQAWRENRIATRDPQLDVAIDDIETNGGSNAALSSSEIDDLAHQLNCHGLKIGDVA